MEALTGRTAFLKILHDEGVRYLFGNPGTTELPIMDALVDFPDITYVLGLQEATVMGMADGYARASGQLAAVNVHVAPGLGNAMGALYTAKRYGAPVLVTAGQQPQGLGVTEPLLYDSLVPMAAPLVKWAAEITRVADLPRILRRAAKVALAPPAGPVFLSLPGDVLNDRAELNLGAPTRVEDAAGLPAEALERLADRLLAAAHPVICAGHEVCLGDALEELARVAEVLGAPVYTQSAPHSAQFPSEHPLYMGPMVRDQARIRALLEPADLLFSAGAPLFTLSVESEVEPMPPGLPVIQLGQDDWEMGKNYPAEMALRAALKTTLAALLPVLRNRQRPAHAEAAEKRAAAAAADNWSRRREALRGEIAGRAGQKPIDPDFLMERICEVLPDDGVVVDEGITATGKLLSLLPLREKHRYWGLASGGLGFGITGAVGIHLALPARPMVCVLGDGSAMYAPQALWTAAHLSLPITFVIANNASYRILKERLARFRGQAVAKEQFIGMDLNRPAIGFAQLAESMGVRGETIADPEAVEPALKAALAHRDGPTLLDVKIHDGYQG